MATALTYSMSKLLCHRPRLDIQSDHDPLLQGCEADNGDEIVERLLILSDVTCLLVNANHLANHARSDTDAEGYHRKSVGATMHPNLNPL